ncbi:hypothetical protein JZ751_013975 [Albula glossodonta]|uniref:Cell adhesion molecule-related/down-regulated by oncogenes n=1 Tax=Albula glossodonta TaxID=121402 RepID=A0A8T2MZC9_9TELE|nr:hypothetical protein JZ751_013975 [Albula glossodonta]
MFGAAALMADRAEGREGTDRAERAQTGQRGHRQGREGTDRAERAQTGQRGHREGTDRAKRAQTGQGAEKAQTGQRGHRQGRRQRRHRQGRGHRRGRVGTERAETGQSGRREGTDRAGSREGTDRAGSRVGTDRAEWALTGQRGHRQGKEQRGHRQGRVGTDRAERAQTGQRAVLQSVHKSGHIRLEQWRPVQRSGALCRAVAFCAEQWGPVQSSGALCSAVAPCAEQWGPVQRSGALCRAVALCLSSSPSCAWLSADWLMSIWSVMSEWITWECRRGMWLLCVFLHCLQGGATVAGDIPVFFEEPLSVVQKLGGSVMLRCSAHPPTANISWRLNGQDLGGSAEGLGVQLQSGVLLIPSLTNRTLGRYQCLRDFETDDQQEIEVDEGNTAVIQCHLPESQPKAQVRYSVKQEWLETSKGNYLIMPSGNLQIVNATQEDEGTYKCAAYNPVTQEVKTSASIDRLRIRPRIVYPPASRSIMVTKGQRLVLECVASGTPPPQVTWAKDGLDLRYHNNTRFLLSNLLIDTAGEGDSGTYTCRADNGVGAPNSASVLYDVQVFEPPQVSVELQQGLVQWGENVRFGCQAQGKPAPSVVWLHNAQPLLPSPRHRMSARMLRIFNVGPQDQGLYQCMAHNAVGSAQAAAHLLTLPSVKLPSPDILRPHSSDKLLRDKAPKPGSTGMVLAQDCSGLPGKISPAEAPVILSQPRTTGVCQSVRAPEAPDRPTVSTATETSAYVTWIPRGNRGFPIQSFRVELRRLGKGGGDWTVAVENIPPSRTSYKFRVRAVNVLGQSPPSQPSKAYTVVGSGHRDRYWHSITDLQPETAYDIKMQCFNEGGESEFGNVVILETKARGNSRPAPPETSSLGPGHPGGPVPRPSDLPYLIVGVVLGAVVFIIVAFIPFCLWRAWAKQKQASDLCFPAVAVPISSCQYTMVPLQGLPLGVSLRPAPLMTPPSSSSLLHTSQSAMRMQMLTNSLCNGLLTPVEERQYSNMEPLLKEPTHNALQQEVHSCQTEAPLQQREEQDSDG